MTLDKNVVVEIDKILTDGFDDKHIQTHSTKKDVRKALLICKALDFLSVKSGNLYELKENAILAIQDGGIEKYLENIRLDKDLEKTIKDLTKKSLKNQIWYNIMYVTVGGIIGGLIGLLTLLVSPNNTEKLIQELHKMAKQKADNDDNFQTDIQQMRLEITSLEKQVDSLKTASE
ncbi:hypothetical protein [Mariniflexile sp.]|uniref:hypothetical protein n=1 Tax=Mariniflexile sp. TaxID=1979402 RepID=UPI004048648E